MCASAFVPEERVSDIFDTWYNEIPDEFVPVATYTQKIFELIQLFAGSDNLK